MVQDDTRVVVMEVVNSQAEYVAVSQTEVQGQRDDGVELKADRMYAGLGPSAISHSISGSAHSTELKSPRSHAA